MRIGTWNLAGRWTDAHRDLIVAADCDIWLLTEVSERTSLPGHALHVTSAQMAAGRRWAGIASRCPMASRPDPHPASASVQIDETTYVSSVLPWRACGSGPPWVGMNHAAKTRDAVDHLLLRLPAVGQIVWGGDWNHALTGKEHAGSVGGRESIIDALAQLRLVVPTAELPHALDGLLSIDHVAVPVDWSTSASRVVAEHDGKRLSDHDVYVVELTRKTNAGHIAEFVQTSDVSRRHAYG